MSTLSAPAPRRAGLEIPPRVLALKLSALWNAMWNQPFAVWALYAYIFFEYVRPQSIYTALDVLPFSTLSLVAAVAGALTSEMRKRRWTMIDTGMVAYTVIAATT